MRTDIKKTHI